MSKTTDAQINRMNEESPANPNFWVCGCEDLRDIRSSMEGVCPACEMERPGWGYAEQSEINRQAVAIQAGQKKLREMKHELPEPRKKVVPSREEFEAALDWLEADDKSAAEWKAKGWASHPISQPPKRGYYEMIVKRYKHAHR